MGVLGLSNIKVGNFVFDFDIRWCPECKYLEVFCDPRDNLKLRHRLLFYIERRFLRRVFQWKYVITVWYYVLFLGILNDVYMYNVVAYINYICLPASCALAETKFRGESLLMAGWGLTSPSK